MGTQSDSSSDVDDAELERLRSVAVDWVSVAASLSQPKKKRKQNTKDNLACSDDDAAPSPLKFYQARARVRLHEYLDKTFDIKFVKYEERELPGAHTSKDADDGGFHLFKRAPCGLSDKSRHQQEASCTPKKQLHDGSQDEDSETFQASVLASAIDGTTVALYAEKEKAKALASWMLHQAKEDESKREEEERIALLKMQRGEQWLPSLGKEDMQLDSFCGRKSPVTKATDRKRWKDLHRKDATQSLKKGSVKGSSSIAARLT